MIPAPPAAGTPSSESARTALIPIPPLTVAEPRPPGRASAASAAAEAAAKGGRRWSVLIIDDELAFNEALGRILTERGFNVHTASSAYEGLGLAIAAKPNLILLDLLLPDRSGLEVCRLLREQPATRAIPILMLSNRGGTDDEVAGLNQGADDYLAKPYIVEVLLARIRKQLERGKSSVGGDGRSGGRVRDLRA
jgi:DNA-binding response OmpR family regulator